MNGIMKLCAEGSASIQEASQKLEDLWSQLEDIQHEDPEEYWRQFKICLLLNTLSAEYDHIVANMQESADLTYDKVMKWLYYEELW